MEVNSKKYWDNRFNTDWILNSGKQQSDFFCRIAIEAFPDWLISMVEKNRNEICDWGCAMGDGTAVLKKRFPNCSIIGIDFSDTAIESAASQYRDITFLCKNLLEKKGNKDFDIVFSSNTLEHFGKPWSVLEKIATYTKEHIILLVPYKEQDKHSEHEYIFTEGNIPDVINESFFLSHAEIIDSAEYTPNYWGQLQALLIYTAEKTLRDNELRPISSGEIRIIESIFQQKVTKKLVTIMKAEMAGYLTELLSAVNNRISSIEREIDSKNELIKQQQNLLEVRQLLAIQQSLEKSLADRDLVISELKSENEQISLLNEENAALQYKIEVEKKASRDAECNFRVTVENLTADIAEKDNYISSLISTIGEAKTHSIETAKAMVSLQDAYDQEQVKNSITVRNLNDRIEALEKSVSERDIIINAYKEDLNKTAKIIDKLEQDISNKEILMMQQRKQIISTEDELQERNIYILKLRKEQENLSEINRVKEVLERKLSEKEKENAELKNVALKVAPQLGIKKILEDKVSEYKKISEDLKQECITKTKLVDDMTISISNLEAYVKKLQQDIEWYRSTFENRSMLGLLKHKAGKFMPRAKK